MSAITPDQDESLLRVVVIDTRPERRHAYLDKPVSAFSLRALLEGFFPAPAPGPEGRA